MPQVGISQEDWACLPWAQLGNLNSLYLFALSVGRKGEEREQQEWTSPRSCLLTVEEWGLSKASFWEPWEGNQEELVLGFGF